MIKTPSGIVLGGAGIFKNGMTQLGGIINLNLVIKQLFANSEQGFTQTLDDYSILFQDAAGTTALTGAGQTLGLVLDKSKGLVLGSELVTNGDFSNGSTGWTLSSAVVSGGSLVATSAGDFLSYNTNPLTIGKWYKVEFDVLSYTAGIDIRIVSGSNLTNRVSALIGHKKAFIYADGTSFKLQAAGGPFTGTIDNISVKELAGNHSYQTTSSYRPLLQNTPRRIQYDGIDDKLTTTLPAQLTGCTVIRAIPNVGCQILTNQTIPTPYNDSTSHCGLIVINRALTAYETSLVTQIFNKLAGV